jgi:hypothetical protein
MGVTWGPYFSLIIISFVSVAATFLCQLVAKFCQEGKTHLELLLLLFFVGATNGNPILFYFILFLGKNGYH